MKSFKKLLILASVVAAYNSAYAQNSYSGYFLDNYTYRYEMNPAFGNSKGFVSMPVIGNFNTAIRGTLHLSDIFYKSPRWRKDNALHQSPESPCPKQWASSATATKSEPTIK